MRGEETALCTSSYARKLECCGRKELELLAEPITGSEIHARDAFVTFVKGWFGGVSLAAKDNAEASAFGQHFANESSRMAGSTFHCKRADQTHVLAILLLRN